MDSDTEEKSIDPCSIMHVSQEELEYFCRPWKNSLIVHIWVEGWDLDFLKQD